MPLPYSKVTRAWPVSTATPSPACTVFTVPAVLLMLGLGVWQLERLQWKTALIAERTERVGGSPIALPGPNADLAQA